MTTMQHDPVTTPKHYVSHPSGVECLQVTRHMGFNLGNAMKYVWRADLKHEDGGIEDLEKALTYIADEIETRKHGAHGRPPIVLVAPAYSEVEGYMIDFDRYYAIPGDSGFYRGSDEAVEEALRDGGIVYEVDPAKFG